MSIQCSCSTNIPCGLHIPDKQFKPISSPDPLASIAESLGELVSAMKEGRLFIGPLDSSGSHEIGIASRITITEGEGE